MFYGERLECTSIKGMRFRDLPAPADEEGLDMQHDVGQLATFQWKGKEQLGVLHRTPMLVANLHLHFGGMKQQHVAQLQMAHLLSAVEAEAKSGAAIVICGDHNATPGSPTYSLVSAGTAEVPVPWGSPLKRQHSLQLQSAYAEAKGEPEVTCFTTRFRGCLDYIWYSRENWEVSQVVPLPQAEEMMESYETPGLPCKEWPSDHLCLVATLQPRSQHTISY